MELFFSAFAVVVSIVSLVISYISIREQRNASKSTAAYAYLATAETLLEHHPELFQLHNIDEKLLDECNVSHVELLYLMQSFVSSDLYHRVGQDKDVTLSDYRKNLLSNQKVQKVWKIIIRDRLISPSRFSNEVDKYIERQESLELGHGHRAPNNGMHPTADTKDVM
jgi:hypothetical protein